DEPRSVRHLQSRQDGPARHAMSFAEELAAVVGAQHVEQIPEGLRVAPGSAAEVAEVIQRAGKIGAAIYPVGRAELARLRHGPVGAGDRPRVWISTQRLDQVLQLDEQSLLVHAQAGLTGLEL